jgi:hypothetical protein
MPLYFEIGYNFNSCKLDKPSNPDAVREHAHNKKAAKRNRKKQDKAAARVYHSTMLAAVIFFISVILI